MSGPEQSPESFKASEGGKLSPKQLQELEHLALHPKELDEKTLSEVDKAVEAYLKRHPEGADYVERLKNRIHAAHDHPDGQRPGHKPKPPEGHADTGHDGKSGKPGEGVAETKETNELLLKTTLTDGKTSVRIEKNKIAV